MHLTKTPQRADHVSRLVEPSDAPAATWPTELFVLEGADRADLQRRAARLAEFCRQQPATRLSALAYSLDIANKRNAANNHAVPDRLAIVAASLDELVVRLTRAADRLAQADCVQIQDGAGIYYASQPLGRTGRVAWLFPGEGAQYPNMLGDLADCFPIVRQCAGAMAKYEASDSAKLSMADLLILPDDSVREAAEQQLRSIDDGIRAVLSADWAIASLLTEFGLQPDVIGGHSAGELAALSTAGCFDTAQNTDQVGGMLREFAAQGEAADGADAALVAIGTSREKLAQIIDGVVARTGDARLASELFIGMDNCPHQVVLVGTSAAVALVEPELVANKLMHERLPFNRPYHTELFRPYLGPLKRMFDAIDFHPPRTTVYSCSTGAPFSSDPAEIRELALNHWAMPVAFPKMIRAMHADGVRLFVEVGPRGNLTAFVHDILRNEQFLAVSASVQRRHGLTQLQHLLGQLAAQHVPLRLDPLFSERNVQTINWDHAPAHVPLVMPAPTAMPSAAVAAPNRQAPVATTPTSAPAAPAPTFAATPAPRPVEIGAPVVPQPRAIAPQVAPTSPALDNRSAVVARHFQVMERWLDDQQHVIEQFLAHPRRGAAPAVPARSTTPPRPAAPATSPRTFATAPVAPVHAVAPVHPAALPQPVNRLTTIPPAPAAPPASPIAEPKFRLLGEIVEHVPGQQLVARRRLDLAEDHYADEHTVGGRDVSKVDPEQRGLPVMPMTFILEMMAETATQLFPGKVARAIGDIVLMRWLAIEDEPGTVEMRAKVQPATAGKKSASGTGNASPEIHIRVEVRDLGTASSPRNEPQQLAAVGTVVLADDYLPAPPARRAVSDQAVPCKVTVADAYKSLFHGPLFQGIVSLDLIDDQGIEATIQVQPRRGLFTSDPDPNFLLDPVTIDIGLHPAASWHVAQPDQNGRILLPCAMERIELYGPRPPEHTTMRARAWIISASQRQFTQSGEISTVDGRVWCRLHHLKCWRFYLPFGEVNFNGPKDQYFISQPWRPWTSAADASEQTVAAAGGSVFDRQDVGESADRQLVRAAPTPDMNQPGLQIAAARVTLSPDELRQFNQQSPGDERTDWFVARVTAKEAVRILWRRMHGVRLYTADVEVALDEQGRFRCSPRAAARPHDFPSVAVATAAGEFTALATSTGTAGVGLVRVDKRGALPKAAPDAAGLLSDAERKLARQAAKLHKLDGAEARLVAARQAVASAVGPIAAEGLSIEIRSLDSDGTVLVAAPVTLSTSLAPGELLKVSTARDGLFVVATWCGETQSR